MTDESRYFLTGSDFSELAALDTSVKNELNSTGQLDQLVATESAIKTAKFKKIDWNQMETNLIK